MEKFKIAVQVLKKHLAELQVLINKAGEVKDWDEWKRIYAEMQETEHEIALLGIINTSTPDEKDLLSLMHDTMNYTDHVRWQIEQLDEWLKTNKAVITGGEIKDKTAPFIIAEYMRSRRKELIGIIDTYYVREKAKKIEPKTI